MKRKRILCLVLVLLMLESIFTGCAKQQKALPEVETSEGYTSLSDLDNKKIGVVTGTMTAVLVPKLVPNAQYVEFNSTADVKMALDTGKVDAFPTDESIYIAMLWEGEEVDRIDEAIAPSDYGFLFGKGKNLTLQEEVNTYIADIREDGRFQALQEKWFNNQEPEEFASYEDLTGERGTLKVGICSATKPFTYVKNGFYAGYDIDMIVGFCAEYGYKVVFEDTLFASILAGVSSGIYDIGASGFTITEERRESVDFSDIYHTEDLVFLVKADSSTAAGEKTMKDWIASVMSGFEKTFIREQRWKLIVEGIATTLLISVLAVVGGTLLGFGLYMLVRSSEPRISVLAKGIAKIYCAIIAGTPTLVILMILFYIVFASGDVGGVTVAIIGFILTFGAYVYDNLSLTVSGVDKGQLEAAYALGYSRNHAFFRVVLPQAMAMFLPGYTGEIITLIKATSVVGYIAVNDLTKVGDIIRGNTYEAFFPLISVALIYFAITRIMASLLGTVRKKTDPKRRKNKDILKGVVR